jgi:hypothetical protein
MYWGDVAAKALFEWAAARKNDASETSIAYLAQKAGTSEAPENGGQTSGAAWQHLDGSLRVLSGRKRLGEGSIDSTYQ